MNVNWSERANLSQASLEKLFWNNEIQMYNIWSPCPEGKCNTIFHYWWMAHAIEVLVDGFARTKDNKYLDRLEKLRDGIFTKNNANWTNDLYDDMEWMAIGWLRVYEYTLDETYLNIVLELWKDIKTGWNQNEGGGIAWHKHQLAYKNTPANAPAVILATRLYKLFKREEDLQWANDIFTWLDETLVNPIDGFVWDGKNRLGDHQIDKDWEFTYCQGVYIGAACELYSITGDQEYLIKAQKTANTAITKLVGSETCILRSEGNGDGDGGLFRGIFIRYLSQLISLSQIEFLNYKDFLLKNGIALWESTQHLRYPLFKVEWDQRVDEKDHIELSTQLSGVILMEALAKLENE